MFLRTLARRVHRLAQYGAWTGSAVALTSALLTWLVNTDWFVMATNDTDSAQIGSFVVAPIQLVTISQTLAVLVLISGFVTVVSVLCGGFRRSLEG